MIYPVVVVVTSYSGGSPTALNVFDISDITQFFVHIKSSSISQLINGKSEDFQKLLKHFNGAATSASNTLLLFDVLPIIFVLDSKNSLFCSYLSYYHYHQFH